MDWSPASKKSTSAGSMDWSPAMESVRSITLRKISLRLISLGLTVTFALVISMVLVCITGGESPMVVVFSGSMEPAFHRGDIVFFHMPKDPIRAGDIVEYSIDEARIPIVHRVIKVHDKDGTGEAIDILTKGDDNLYDDISLYKGQRWVNRQHIRGKAVGFLPYVGWAIIIMTEKPLIQYIVIGALSLLILTTDD